MHSCVVYYGNRLIPEFFFIFRPIKLVLNFGLRPKDYTRMISSVFIRWLLLLSISANRTWIYLLILARLPLLRSSSWLWCLLLLMLGLNKHSLTSSSWSLLLSASVRILSLFVIRFLVVHQFRPWMMCLLASSVSRPLRLCHLIALQILLC